MQLCVRMVGFLGSLTLVLRVSGAGCFRRHGGGGGGESRSEREEGDWKKLGDLQYPGHSGASFLCSFKGGSNKQRAMLVFTVTCIPVVAIWANTTRILLFLGQDRSIAAEAGTYARWLIPSLVPYVPLVCHIRFLQTQSIVVPVMASSAVTVLTHVLVCWALVQKAGMGSKGAALSGAISYSANLAMLTLYTRLSGACKRT